MGGERHLLPDSGSRSLHTHLHLPQHTWGALVRWKMGLCTCHVQEENKEESLCSSLSLPYSAYHYRGAISQTLQIQQPLTPGYFRTDSLWRHARKRKRGAGQVHGGSGRDVYGPGSKGRGRKTTASPLPSCSALPSFILRHRLPGGSQNSSVVSDKNSIKSTYMN